MMQCSGGAFRRSSSSDSVTMVVVHRRGSPGRVTCEGKEATECGGGVREGGDGKEVKVRHLHDSDNGIRVVWEGRL